MSRLAELFHLLDDPHGNFDMVRQLVIEIGPRAINRQQIQGITALHKACEVLDDPEKIRFFLDHGANGLHDGMHMDDTPLHHICARQGLALVSYCYERFRTSFDRVFTKKNTVFVRACGTNPDVGVIRFLHEAYPRTCGLAARDRDRSTPMHEACGHQTNPDVLRYLFQQGGQEFMNAKNVYDDTPLYSAACTQKSPEVMRVILQHASPRDMVTTKAGPGTATPFHALCMWQMDPKLFRLFLEHGAVHTLAMRNERGKTPFEVRFGPIAHKVYQNMVKTTLLKKSPSDAASASASASPSARRFRHLPTDVQRSIFEIAGIK